MAYKNSFVDQWQSRHFITQSQTMQKSKRRWEEIREGEQIREVWFMSKCWGWRGSPAMEQCSLPGCFGKREKASKIIGGSLASTASLSQLSEQMLQMPVLNHNVVLCNSTSLKKSTMSCNTSWSKAIISYKARAVSWCYIIVQCLVMIFSALTAILVFGSRIVWLEASDLG